MPELSLSSYMRIYESWGYKLSKVRLNKICFDYHDDVPFRVYYLMTKDKTTMKLWRKEVDHGKKGRRKKTYTARYIDRLHGRVIETPIKNTKFDWSCQPSKGQILMPVPFAVNKKGIYYPAGGMGRITLAYFLGHRYIPSYVKPTSEGAIWKKDFGVTSKHFRGMPQEVIDMLLFRRKVSNRLMMACINNKVNRPDFLYEVPDLALRGKYNLNVLMNDKSFITTIKNRTILNMTLDNGWLDVNCSKHVKSITGYGPPLFRGIASDVFNYFKAKNGTFVSDIKEITKSPEIIICNRMVKVPEGSHLLENKKVIYKKNDCVVYG